MAAGVTPPYRGFGFRDRQPDCLAASSDSESESESERATIIQTSPSRNLATVTGNGILKAEPLGSTWLP
jgi:hypothetical protein